MALPKKIHVWQEPNTWRALGYTYYSNSSDFREVLDLNQSFDIRRRPAEGVPVYVSAEGRGKTSEGFGLPGTLQQVEPGLNFSGDKSGSTDADVAAAIFPWPSVDEYVNRLAKHTVASLYERDRINGYDLDSPQARGNSQRG